MGLFGYNRMLGWVVAPLVIWALIAMSMALGATYRGPGHSRYRLAWQLEEAPHAFVVPGQLRRVDELVDRLILTVELPEAERPRDLHPGPGLVVRFVDPGNLPPGPLAINMLEGMNEPHKLRRGRMGLLSRQFLLIFDERSIRVLPRPRWLKPQPRPRDDGALPGVPPGMGRIQPGPGERMMQRRQDQRKRIPGGDNPPKAAPGRPDSSAPRDQYGGDSGLEWRGVPAPQGQ